MFTPQRAAQLGLGAVSVVLVLCMGVLIANGVGATPVHVQGASLLSSDVTTSLSQHTDSTSTALARN